MTVYVTKYALTDGIGEIEAETFKDAPNMVRDHNGNGYASYYHKPDWHESLVAAKARAEKMRLNKIASLKKQLEKLEKMKF